MFQPKHKQSSQNFNTLPLGRYSFQKIVISTADTCKNCAKCGIGFKIGTNEAYNREIKIRLGGHFENFLLLFSRQYGCLRQRYFTEEEILEKAFT